VAFIRQVPEDEAEGELARIYEAARARAGGVANILRVMSQRPKLLGAFIRFYVVLMKEETALPSREKELLAAATSHTNGCFY
jgi:alkylhydroperoxidase family enzyme